MPEKHSEAWHLARTRRWEIWKHNSFLGHCAMAKQNMSSIQTSSTATSQSILLAGQISGLLTELAQSLKERKDG